MNLDDTEFPPLGITTRRRSYPPMQTENRIRGNRAKGGQGNQDSERMKIAAADGDNEGGQVTGQVIDVENNQIQAHIEGILPVENEQPEQRHEEVPALREGQIGNVAGGVQGRQLNEADINAIEQVPDENDPTGVPQEVVADRGGQIPAVHSEQHRQAHVEAVVQVVNTNSQQRQVLGTSRHNSNIMKVGQGGGNHGRQIGYNKYLNRGRNRNRGHSRGRGRGFYEINPPKGNELFDKVKSVENTIYHVYKILKTSSEQAAPQLTSASNTVPSRAQSQIASDVSYVAPRQMIAGTLASSEQTSQVAASAPNVPAYVAQPNMTSPVVVPIILPTVSQQTCPAALVAPQYTPQMAFAAPPFNYVAPQNPQMTVGYMNAPTYPNPTLISPQVFTISPHQNNIATYYGHRYY